MNSSPDRRDRLNFEQVRSAIDGLRALGSLRTVIFAGGEPTLLRETLLDCIAYVDSLGMNTRVVTNASWAISDDKARRKINQLRDAGLQELNISADDYHLPYIPFENVEAAWRACKGMGFRAVVIANCYGPESLVTPRYIMDRLGEKLPLRFDADGVELPLALPSADGSVYALSNAYVQNLGRAQDSVAAGEIWFPESESDLDGGCPWAVRSAALSPRNHLVACCGIECEGNEILDFGDANTLPVEDLLRRANDSVIVNAIALLGPRFLKSFIEERDPKITFRDRYASVCEICSDVVSRPETRAALSLHMADLAGKVLVRRRRVASQQHSAAAQSSLKPYSVEQGSYQTELPY